MTPEGFQCVSCCIRIDVCMPIAYIYLHTVCGYPVDVFCCRFVCISFVSPCVLFTDL